MSRWDAVRERKKGNTVERDPRTCAEIVAESAKAPVARAIEEEQLRLFGGGA